MRFVAIFWVTWATIFSVAMIFVLIGGVGSNQNKIQKLQKQQDQLLTERHNEAERVSNLTLDSQRLGTCIITSDTLAQLRSCNVFDNAQKGE